MRPKNMQNATLKTQLFLALIVAATLLLAPAAFAAAPGISAGTGPSVTFNLTAADSYLNQPDGSAVYSWGYGCKSGFTPTFLPSTISPPPAGCPTMQVPAPTLIVTEGQ